MTCAPEVAHISTPVLYCNGLLLVSGPMPNHVRRINARALSRLVLH
jgi:hypothetical protein